MKKYFNTHLLKLFLVSGLLATNIVSTYAQEKKESFFGKYSFVNMTELGVLLGRSKYEIYSGYYWGSVAKPASQYQVQNRVNFTLQTFNGVHINSKTAAGITLGVDAYGPTILMPVALGVRRNIIQKKQGGSILLGSLDAGYSTTWLNEDNTGYKTTGGLMISPAIGYKLPMRNGSAWLINFGYRYQRAEYTQERQGDPFWYESNEVRNYRRVIVRVGIQF